MQLWENSFSKNGLIVAAGLPRGCSGASSGRIMVHLPRKRRLGIRKSHRTISPLKTWETKNGNLFKTSFLRGLSKYLGQMSWKKSIPSVRAAAVNPSTYFCACHNVRLDCLEFGLLPLIPCVKNYADFSVRAETAWSSLGLPSAWHAEDINLDKREFFRRRFNGLPENAELRQAQSEALCAALGMDGSGLLIIEAPMGNGKTEASLLCAEVLAAKSGAGGLRIFFRRWQRQCDVCPR